MSTESLNYDNHISMFTGSLIIVTALISPGSLNCGNFVNMSTDSLNYGNHINKSTYLLTYSMEQSPS
jgi:hypothetical protein